MLAPAQQRIRELEDEVKILRKAAAAIEKVVPPKDRFQLVAKLVDHSVDARRDTVSSPCGSHFFDWRTRAPSARAIRKFWLSDRIAAVRKASHGYLRSATRPDRTGPWPGYRRWA